MSEEYIVKLIQSHWEYIEGLLKVHGENEESLKIIKYHYTTAMRHGIKHGLELAKV